MESPSLSISSCFWRRAIPVALLTFDPTIRQDERERLAIKLGVNDPFLVQYLRWLIGDDWMMVDSNADGELDSWGDNYGILRGDFGTSFKFRGSNPLKLIGERLGATLELNIAVVLIGIGNGILIGVLAALKRGRAFDKYSRIFAVLGDSVPGLLVRFAGNHVDGHCLAAHDGTIRHRKRQSISADGRTLPTRSWRLPARVCAPAIPASSCTSKFLGANSRLVAIHGARQCWKSSTAIISAPRRQRDSQAAAFGSDTVCATRSYR